jgi:hypothetical protein
VPAKPTESGPGKKDNTSFFFTKYVMEERGGKQVADLRSEDPREALLKMDAKAKDDPMFLGELRSACRDISALVLQ